MMTTRLLILSIPEKEEKPSRSTCLVSTTTTRLFILSISEGYCTEHRLLNASSTTSLTVPLLLPYESKYLTLLNGLLNYLLNGPP